MEIIRERRRVERVEYSLSFPKLNVPGASWCFDTDENFQVDTSKLQPAGLENYLKCIDPDAKEKYGIGKGEQEVYRSHYYEAAVGRCVCGREVELWDSWLNTCECGRDYNGFGQLLAPRSQWGEETGETLTDMMNPDPEGDW